MAIKKLHIGFDIDVADFVAYIAARNTGMKIDVLGENKPAKIPRVDQKLLEGPRKPRQTNGVPSWHYILKAMCDDPKATRTIKELSAIVVAHGLAKNSASPQVDMLRKRGWMKRTAPGVYIATPRGIAEAQKLGLIQGGEVANG